MADNELYNFNQSDENKDNANPPSTYYGEYYTQQTNDSPEDSTYGTKCDYSYTYTFQTGGAYYTSYDYPHYYYNASYYNGTDSKK